MSKKLLIVGDVIALTAGMKVYAVLPECFVYANRRDSPMDKLAKTDIRLGEVRSNERGEVFDTARLCGRYVVEEVSCSGGGTQLSMSGGTEEWPDGHHVVARRLSPEGDYDENGEAVTFYQTGCFTAMVKPDEISPIGKMRRTFVPLRLSPVDAATGGGATTVPPELADLIRQAQAHMLRTPEADAVSVRLTQYLMGEHR